MNFELRLEEKIRSAKEQPRERRFVRREANPTVQMSVRMQESSYERFRAICEMERRTNGEMLEEMMVAYIKMQSRGLEGDKPGR